MTVKSNPAYIQLKDRTDSQLFDRLEQLEQGVEDFNSHDFLTSDWLAELEAIEHELDARDLALQDDKAAQKEVY